jgi:hypothetical protein
MLRDDNTNKGIIVTGTVMGADAAKPGSWGLWGKFYDQGSTVLLLLIPWMVFIATTASKVGALA